MQEAWERFRCHVYTEGYCWRQVPSRSLLEGGGEPTVWVLTPINPSGPMKTYRPLAPNMPALMALVGLSSNGAIDQREAILAFTNRYGHLGLIRQFDFGRITGENYTDWCQEISDMWRAVEQWHALSKTPPRWWPLLIRLGKTARAWS